MDEKKMENMIRTALINGTESTVELEEEVWEYVQKNIKGQRRKGRKIKTRKKRLWFAFVSAAAVLMLTFLFTEPGQAGINKVKEWFAPKKVIVEEVEGQKEQKEVTLNKSKVGYVIYFDEKMYRVEKLNGKDRIVPLVQGSPDLPKVYMEIRQVTDQTPEALASSLEKQVKEQYPIIIQTGKVSEPVKGYVIQGESGRQWNDEVVKYYLVDNGQGGTFVIEQHYFVEASEGHGARFDNMLKQFRVTKELDKQQ
ncbi:hypothetical protein H839_01566 [Parageobacillus genomosp. 1]|uniref:DUF4367 domain-containing protein n=1 Tax=Parageobacillus genomosp. 1 TaxID=1295642 RepID=A0ABC9VIG9_9BACL|nr:hypothetical protein [Parageobacillus genomosp. 1]EZP78515.1 hypothetical protein H839_01566 [Parageobacillus genomosp. 1]